MIMSSLEFIGPPKILGPPLNLVPQPNLIFCSGPPQLFWSEIFSPPPLKLGGGCYQVSSNIISCYLISRSAIKCYCT